MLTREGDGKEEDGKRDRESFRYERNGKEEVNGEEKGGTEGKV